MPKEINVGNDSIPQGHTIPLGEIGKHAAFEQVAENDLTKDALEHEAFMNEPVTIIVHQAVEEGQLPIQTPSVNGVNQPIIRGQEITVKRKYVEALARCRTTKYVQNIDQRDLSNIQMVEQTVVSYPFSIIKDTAKGAAWIKKILAER
jgi:hypothetical protein